MKRLYTLFIITSLTLSLTAQTLHYDRPAQYFEEALPIMLTTNKSYDAAYIYSCLANLYFEVSDYSKAKENALLAKESYEVINPNDLSLASALYILGLIYNNEANP